MLSPSCTKKEGSQVTNPKIKVFITIRVVAPTIMRGNSAGLNKGTETRGGRSRGARHGRHKRTVLVARPHFR